ncbi:hypothetical protein ACFFRR_010324 [Megaselia abdita]
MAEERFTHIGDITGEKPLLSFKEIKIKVPWGHISGKWYGSQNVRPIVCIHGWMDNAGTFDTLIPLLSRHLPFLAVDLPGHGLSSRIPDGCYYNSIDNIFVIRLIMQQYNWDKISLIGHSMGSIVTFAFASLYPDKVDLAVGLDALKPHQRAIPKQIETIATRMEEFLKEDERNRSDSEPPSYTYDELIDRLFVGSFHSVNKDTCQYLLARNIKRSKLDSNKFYFVRDRRLKYYNYQIGNQDLVNEMARRITCPYLFVKANSSTYFEEKKFYFDTLSVMKENPKFELAASEGTHHFHLNNPEKVCETINTFICKYRPQDVPTSKL